MGVLRYWEKVTAPRSAKTVFLEVLFRLDENNSILELYILSLNNCAKIAVYPILVSYSPSTKVTVITAHRVVTFYL
jgi:hypothetical protein